MVTLQLGVWDGIHPGLNRVMDASQNTFLGTQFPTNIEGQGCMSLLSSFIYTHKIHVCPTSLSLAKRLGRGSVVREITIQTWAPELNSEKSHKTFWV